MPNLEKSRALFLDRDGVVNEEVGYLHRAEEVRWVAGIVPLCLTAQSLGYKLVVVTNQAGIGYGLYSEEQFQSLMTWMRAELAQQGITLDAVYHCPFHPEHGIGDYKRDHEDRKPSPGMLLRAARELDLDLPQSILVGDRCSDLAAARAAGLRQAFLMSGTEPEPCVEPHTPISSLAEVETWLRVNS
jgi:D-glycero-D-manno-heptose 1,7-bisphosphate phosphatase